MIVTTTHREVFHWLWLWALAAIVVAVMQAPLFGNRFDSYTSPVANAPPSAGWQDSIEVEPGWPIPMPNVDQPEQFRYPLDERLDEAETVSLSELLLLHRKGKFEEALVGWRRMKPTEESRTWRQTAMGVSHLKLGQLDEALACLNLAADLDETNAVAEYFLGRVRQAEGRGIPFWYEKNGDAEFQLASKLVSSGSTVEPVGPPGESENQKMFLPHFIDDAFARLARQHFRRAIILAPKCSLDRVIRIVPATEPTIQLAEQSLRDPSAVTVGDLLDSLGERDFVQKAKTELGAPRID